MVFLWNVCKGKCLPMSLLLTYEGFSIAWVFMRKVYQMFFMAIKLLSIQDIVGDIQKISRGTVCKVGSADEDWIVEVGPVNEKYYIYINGTYYIPTLNNGNIIYHAWAKTAQLIPRNYVRDSIQPTCNIKRKVMMYPDPSNLDDPAFYLCLDFKNPELVEEINVPVYPKVEEPICIFGAYNQNWFGWYNRLIMKLEQLL